MAISTIALFAISSVSIFFLKTIQENERYQKASFLAEEAIELVRSVKDANWISISNLTMGSDYHLVIIESVWSLQPGSETFAEFTRKVVFSSVNRDSSDNIVTSGGTNDSNTKKVTATVSWGNKNVILTTYITKIQ